MATSTSANTSTTIKGAVLDAVTTAVNTVAQSSTTQLSPVDAPLVARQVQAQIASDPVVQHLTNTEPWWQSRVTLGAIATIFAGLGTEVTLVSQHNYDVQTHLAGLGAIAGAFLTLWGRWVSTKPLGA